MRVYMSKKEKLLSSTYKGRNTADVANATCFYTEKLPSQAPKKWPQEKHGSISIHSVFPQETLFFIDHYLKSCSVSTTFHQELCF